MPTAAAERALTSTSTSCWRTVVRRIEIIGEAARGVSPSLRSEHPEVEWQPIKATRHILVHEYRTVNYDVIGRIVQVHLPVLIQQLERLIAQYPPPSPGGDESAS